MSDLSEALRLFTTNVGGRSRLVVGGEIDLATVGALRDHLDLLVASGIGDIDVDMASVTFCDATVLAVLVAAHQTLNSVGRHIHVINASESMTRLVRLAGLDTTLFAPPHRERRIIDTLARRPCRSRRTPASGEGSQEGATDADRQTHHRPCS